MNAYLAKMFTGAGSLALAFGTSAACCRAQDTPYGEDAIPNSHYYTGAWSEYGTDALPPVAASETPWHKTYGEDTVPSVGLPGTDDSKQLFGFEGEQVLTKATEQGRSNDNSHSPNFRRCP